MFGRYTLRAINCTYDHCGVCSVLYIRTDPQPGGSAGVCACFVTCLHIGYVGDFCNWHLAATYKWQQGTVILV